MYIHTCTPDCYKGSASRKTNDCDSCKSTVNVTIHTAVHHIDYVLKLMYLCKAL